MAAEDPKRPAPPLAPEEGPVVEPNKLVPADGEGAAPKGKDDGAEPNRPPVAEPGAGFNVGPNPDPLPPNRPDDDAGAGAPKGLDAAPVADPNNPVDGPGAGAPNGLDEVDPNADEGVDDPKEKPPPPPDPVFELDPKADDGAAPNADVFGVEPNAEGPVFEFPKPNPEDVPVDAGVPKGEADDVGAGAPKAGAGAPKGDDV